MKKITSLIMIILIVSMTFSVSLSLPKAKAQEQEGCCLNTGSQQCVTTTKDECPGRFYTGPPYDCSNVNECKPQTCIPKNKDEQCIRNKPAAECRAMGGVPENQPLESISQCELGCCIIAKGVKAEVLQKRQCENLTQALGYDLDMMEFKEGITSQIECKKQGSPSDLGCCDLGAGICSYGPRADCKENFVPLAGGLFCRDVSSCALTTHSYVDCGKLPGTETDIYWYDSQGNQEDINESCNYPNAICSKDTIGNVYCMNTKCENLDLKDQVMSNNPPKVNIRRRTITLLSGTSTCYNFYTAYGDNRMHERSTGLQNEILHCSFGKINKEGLGVDRKKLCVLGGEAPALIHGTVKENKWENCSQCGVNKGVLGGIGNSVGDFLGPAWIGLPTGKMFSGLFGDYCNKDKCEGLNGNPGYGDCYYHQDMPAFLGGTPEGSCDPIYPPGLANSKCSECGAGGDAMWNLCTRDECYSKGDCQFHENNDWAKTGTFAWEWIGLATGERISQIIPECVATTIYCKLSTDPACLHVSNNNLLQCLYDRTKTYGIAMPPWIVGGKLFGMAWSALSGKVTSSIIDKATSAIMGKVTGGGEQGGEQGQQGGQGGGS